MQKYLFIEDKADEEQGLKDICLYVGRGDEVLKLKQKLLSDGYATVYPKKVIHEIHRLAIEQEF